MSPLRLALLSGHSGLTGFSSFSGFSGPYDRQHVATECDHRFEVWASLEYELADADPAEFEEAVGDVLGRADQGYRGRAEIGHGADPQLRCEPAGLAGLGLCHGVRRGVADRIRAGPELPL